MGVGHDVQCCYREQISYAIYSRLVEPRLYKLAMAGDWDLMPDRIAQHPKEAAFVHKYAPHDTVLHRIVRPNAAEAALLRNGDLDQSAWNQIQEMKLAAITSVLEAHQPAAAQQDSLGRTPLHLVCMDELDGLCGGKDAALALIDAYPQAITTPDVEGRTPLHHLLLRRQCHTTSPACAPMVHALLETILLKCPSVVDLTDIVGETPLDIARRRCPDMCHGESVVQMLMTVHNKLQQN